jgi:hypothetical protein
VCLLCPQQMRAPSSCEEDTTRRCLTYGNHLATIRAQVTMLGVRWCVQGIYDPLLPLCRRLRTRFIETTHNPVWEERHEVYLADEADTIKLWVKVRPAGLTADRLWLAALAGHRRLLSGHRRLD